jgi:membrane-associated phospholipid phosphatase
LSSIWSFITDFGDTAVTVPLAALMLCFLVVAKKWRLALAWALAILGCAGMIGGLKLILDACGTSFATAGLASPSGHAAMSAVVYGGFAAVLGVNLAPAARAALIVCAAALIVAMPVSRVTLHIHTPTDAVVGLAVGLAAVAIIVAAVAIHHERLPTLWLAGAAVALAMFFHGERWPAEREIHHLAGWFGVPRAWCNDAPHAGRGLPWR